MLNVHTYLTKQHSLREQWEHPLFMVQNDNRNKNQHALLQYLLKQDSTTFLRYAFPHGLLHWLHLLPERHAGRCGWPPCISPADGPIITLQFKNKIYGQTELRAQRQQHEMWVDNVYIVSKWNLTFIMLHVSASAMSLMQYCMIGNLIFCFILTGLLQLFLMYTDWFMRSNPPKLHALCGENCYWTWLNTHYICLRFVLHFFNMQENNIKCICLKWQKKKKHLLSLNYIKIGQIKASRQNLRACCDFLTQE